MDAIHFSTSAASIHSQLKHLAAISLHQYSTLYPSVAPTTYTKHIYITIKYQPLLLECIWIWSKA